MSASCFNRRPARKRNGYVLVFGTLMIGLVLIPGMGLAIDVGLMYTVEAVMSAAADSAAVAGARDLARGSNNATQLNNAVATANAYFNANFPSGFMWSTNLTESSVAAQNGTSMRSVTTTASVTLPLIFLNMLHIAPQSISTSSTAQRRDINVMIVMDRSGSLANSGSCVPLSSAAMGGFVSKFALGTDNVGLITFGTSSLIDVAPTTNFQTPIDNILNGMNCTGATSSAQALWQAYDQLVLLNQTGSLNAILFFTDGHPTSVTENFPISASSSCTTRGGSATLQGVLTVGFNAGSGVPVVPLGLYVSTAPVQPPALSSDVTVLSGTATKNCAFVSNQQNVGNDLSYAPVTDIWGNSLTATGYLPTTAKSSGLDPTIAQNIQNFSTNAADDAALRIRSGAQDPARGNNSLSGVVIYTIGLANAPGGIDTVLLQRMANDPALSPNPVAAGTQGLFCNAAIASDLNDCFLRVASQMLRISH